MTYSCRIRPEHVTVTIGEHNRLDSAGSVEVRKVLKMMPHSSFTLNTFNSDIAVIEMDRPVDITGPTIRPACLPLTGQPFFVTLLYLRLANLDTEYGL